MPPLITQIDGNSLDEVDAAAGDRLQLLVFSAGWCGPCKAMAPVIDDVAATYRDEVAVVRIDIEASPELAGAFEVRSVPTLVLRRRGQLVERHLGTLTRARLAAKIDQALGGVGATA